MNNSIKFKAAHKMAKANKLALGGDYVVYVSLALKAINTLVKKGYSEDKIFAAMNTKIKSISSELPLITKTVKISATHGLKEFSHYYKLESAKKNLEQGQFFGESFVKNGMVCAWVRSYVSREYAY